MSTQRLLLLLLRLALFAAAVQGFQVQFHHPLQRPTSSLYVSFTADALLGTDSTTLSPLLPNDLLTPPTPTTPSPNSIMDDFLQATAPAPVSTPASVIHLTWETDVEQRIRAAIQERFHHPHAATATAEAQMQQPYMVAIVGIPGSGKSTSCSILTGLLRDVGCLLMPFDGYHYPVATLKTFENAEDALYRRGAPDTFDAEALRRDLWTIKYDTDVPTVSVPGFDHAAGDPEPDAHKFDRANHKVVICEGLYLLHDDRGTWASLKDMFDLTIFVNANVDVCVNRLKERNKCIPGYTPEEIEIRCDAVDRVNAMTVMESQTRADLIVESAATFQPTR